MAKVTDFKTLKRRQMRRRTLKLLALIAAILVGTYLLSSIVNTPSFAGLSSVLDMIKGGPGYPIDAPGGKVQGMYQNGGSLVVLNETNLYFYNTSGSEVYRAQHRMGNPRVASNGTMLLNYDRGSKTYAAYSRNNLFYSGKTENAIRAGDISQNGCIAIATQTENAQTQVMVMDDKQRELYTWKSDNVVTALAISANGSGVAIGSSYVEEGQLKSVLTVLKNGKEQTRYELANQMIYALEFDGANVRCITDKSAFLLGTEGRMIGQFDYKGQQLAAFSMYENGVALVFGNYEQDRKYTLASVADDFYTLNGQTTLTDSLQRVKAYEHTILVLGASSFQEYSAYDCSLIGGEDEGSYYDIQPMGNSVYAMTTTEIMRLPLQSPSKFSLFGAAKPQELPDKEDGAPTQEELDLLQSILNGMEQEADQLPEEELTVGQSEPQTVYEEGFIEVEEPKAPQSEPEGSEPDLPEPEQPEEGLNDAYDRENPDGVLNEGPAQVPIQNEDVKPSFTEEKSDQPQEEHTGRRPAASAQPQEDKAPSETEEPDEPSTQPEDEADSEETKPSDSSEPNQEEEPLFSSRRPAQ